MPGRLKEKRIRFRIRLLVFLAALALHGVLLAFVVVPGGSAIKSQEKREPVIISLVDVREEEPPARPIPPEPAPPPPRKIEDPPVETQEIADDPADYHPADNLIETQTEPEIPQQTAPPEATAPPAFIETGQAADHPKEAREQEPSYLPMSKLTLPPRLPGDQIRRAIVYPPLALRAGIEGVVYLELLIDPQGNIRSITIIRETPANRGFGEAALKALKGIRAEPGEAEGQKVGVRFRYHIRFTLG